MSSVSVEAYSANVGVDFRVKRADDHLTLRSAASEVAPFRPAVAHARDSHAQESSVEPTIVLLIHTPSGLDAPATESLTEFAGVNGALGFTRVIPESAMPAVREAYNQLRRRLGSAGSITALAVERSPLHEPAGSDAADLRNRESLEFQELSIDPARREVWVEGSLIGLTKSEFDLLYVLAQRPGVVFSRRQIVLAYKGADYPVDDRSIDVQMFNLRRKIRSAGGALQTIRGVGYRFTGTPRA